MKKILTGVLAFFCFSAYAQEAETGIHFEHGSWAEIKAKAQKEHKNIFMDAFTTWCGPCKMMAKNIFPLPEAGEFFNKNYINVKVQLDTSKNDNDYIKGWYADAHDIMVGYGVRVFPTYLFISPEGKLLHRAVGSSDIAAFIQKGKDALDPEKQYYTLADRYNAGEKSEDLLKRLTVAAQNAYDEPAMRKYAAEYLATQKDLTSKDNLAFLADVTGSSKDPGFEVILKNKNAFNKVNGEGAAEKLIRTIAFRETVVPKVFRSKEPADWEALQKELAATYSGMEDEIISYSKIQYFAGKTSDWPAFSKEVTSYLKKYNNRLGANELNSYAWQIFTRCDDKNCIDQALEWSKTSVDLSGNHMFMDTYANLLYKKGDKEAAITWEQKALADAVAAKEDTGDYEKTLEKMKSGTKTWD